MIQIGQTEGGYEFLGLLGCSRIGTAYKVRNIVADRIEVLRVLDQEFQEDPEQAERFLREVKVHARLQHPNIVAFYTAIEINGQFAMTSELFEASALQGRLQSGPMPLKEAIVCMSQVLAALEYAHKNGVVHREISPANILVSADGTTKLTGFGLAKSAADPQLTQPGTVMGWLEYMSPEQVKGVPEPDTRTDIYSAGAVLYEMVTGEVPFLCKSEFELMMAHVNIAPVAPISRKPDLPEDLNQIILIALAKDPAQRFQTAGQFLEALERVAPEPASPLALPHLELSAPPERGDMLFTGVLAFIVALAAFFIFLSVAQRLAPG